MKPILLLLKEDFALGKGGILKSLKWMKTKM